MKLTVDRTRDVLLLAATSVLVTTLCNCFVLLSWFSTFLSIWVASVGVSILLNSLKVRSNGKSVLITGCDSGFGSSLAFHLDRLGFEVFAGCLLADSRGEGAEHLRTKGSDRLHVLQLDVCDQKQLTNALHQVKDSLSNGNVLWGIVNNAGISAFGEVEWVSLEVYKKLAEVNLFGVISTTKTFLPLVKKAKGRIVNVASMLGRMAQPVWSPYIITKYAVEGFNDCLRHEMRQWDVKVCIIEPGNFVAATSISTPRDMELQAAEMWASMDEELQRDIGRTCFDSRVKLTIALQNLGYSDRTLVVEAMTDALTQRFPRVRYHPMEFYSWMALLVATHLPEWIYDNIIEKFLHILSSQLGSAHLKRNNE